MNAELVSKIALGAVVPVAVAVYGVWRPHASLRYDIETLHKAKELGLDISPHLQSLQDRLTKLYGDRARVPLRVWAALAFSVWAIAGNVWILVSWSLPILIPVANLAFYSWVALVSLDQIRARWTGRDAWLRNVDHVPLEDPRGAFRSIRKIWAAQKVIRMKKRALRGDGLTETEWAYVQSRLPEVYASWQADLRERAALAAVAEKDQG